MMDKIKLVLSLLLVAAGVAGFYLLVDHALVLRIISVLVGIAAGFFVFSTTPSGHDFIAFSKESIAETKRVVWPSRKETVQTTVAVFVLVIVMALFLWVIDVGFLWMVKTLMGRSA